ncbi:GNAT family N-acetyltransferase [Marinicella sp. W31]|uniref:GNAT family N-acetyltransferase n=1 Tax=Marinicella sp. W31 TaxID=3023713 RepID=UPI003757CA74
MEKTAYKIIKLAHETETVAVDIFQVMQKSYTVEAQLLNIKDFPPLRRTSENIQSSGSTFFGCIDATELAAVVETSSQDALLDIHSMVVKPDHFRQGLAGALLDFIFENHVWKFARVETGRDNMPAIQLYKKHGFSSVRTWQTEFGIIKVELHKYR